MIDGLKPYPKYKDSGVPWLGDVPEHWSITRLKYLFREVDKRSATGDEELLSVSHLTGVTPRREKNVTMFLAESNAGHKVCHPDDVVVNTMWAWMAALGVSRHNGLVSPSYGVYRPIRGDVLSPMFVDRLLRTETFRSEYLRRSTGVNSSRLRLYPEQFLSMVLLYPSFTEQAAIVRFLQYLDRRTNRYINAKKRLMVLLNEQKQAIIHRAVTRGVDSNVLLKPSGVEWLDDVPSHWVITTLGQVACSIRTGPFGSVLHQSDYVEHGVPVVNPTNMKDGAIAPDEHCCVSDSVSEKLKEHRLEKNDVVFSRRGELGRCALVGDREVGWLCGTGSIRVRPSYDRVWPEYLIRVLQSAWVGEWLTLRSVGATMDSLNTAILKGIPLLLPPLDEQLILTKWIHESSVALETAKWRLLKEIDRMRELRVRLISDVVTGKLDVREAALCLPDEEVAELPEIDDTSEEIDDADMEMTAGDAGA